MTATGGRGTVVVASEVTCDEPVDADRWAALMAAVLADEGVAPGARAGLHFVDADDMVGLNREHMGQDGPTDVLAFPIDGVEAVGAAGTDDPLVDEDQAGVDNAEPDGLSISQQLAAMSVPEKVKAALVGT